MKPLYPVLCFPYSPCSCHLAFFYMTSPLSFRACVYIIYASKASLKTKKHHLSCACKDQAPKTKQTRTSTTSILACFPHPFFRRTKKLFQSSLFKNCLLFCRGSMGLLGLLVDTANPVPAGPHFANGSGVLGMARGVCTRSMAGFSKLAILMGGGMRPMRPIRRSGRL